MDMVTKKPVVAPTEVVPKARRRTFNLAFKRKILSEADAAADEPGKVAALLRRHGLYSSHLTERRRSRGVGAPVPHSKQGRRTARRPETCLLPDMHIVRCEGDEP